MSSVSRHAVLDPIRSRLGSRTPLRDVIDSVAAARSDLHGQISAVQEYTGGLPAEVESRKLRLASTVGASRLAARQAWLRRQGRRIDLIALLRQRGKDSMPVWGLADPTRRKEYCSRVDTDGTYYIEYQEYGGCLSRLAIDTGRQVAHAACPADGIPPLPPAARRILLDSRLRRPAKWMQLLYQPAEWTRIDPDPAIIAEWTDLPGEYYCLCVWGGDAGAITEFVG